MGSNAIDGLTQAMHEAREELQQTQDELNVERRTSGILRRQRDELARSLRKLLDTKPVGEIHLTLNEHDDLVTILAEIEAEHTPQIATCKQCKGGPAYIAYDHLCWPCYDKQNKPDPPATEEKPEFKGVAQAHYETLTEVDARGQCDKHSRTAVKEALMYLLYQENLRENKPAQPEPVEEPRVMTREGFAHLRCKFCDSRITENNNMNGTPWCDHFCKKQCRDKFARWLKAQETEEKDA